MTSEGESRQQSIWEHREPEGGSGKPAPAPPKAPGEPRLQAVNQMAHDNFQVFDSTVSRLRWFPPNLLRAQADPIRRILSLPG